MRGDSGKAVAYEALVTWCRRLLLTKYLTTSVVWATDYKIWNRDNWIQSGVTITLTSDSNQAFNLAFNKACGQKDNLRDYTDTVSGHVTYRTFHSISVW